MKKLNKKQKRNIGFLILILLVGFFIGSNYLSVYPFNSGEWDFREDSNLLFQYAGDLNLLEPPHTSEGTLNIIEYGKYSVSKVSEIKTPTASFKFEITGDELNPSVKVYKNNMMVDSFIQKISEIDFWKEKVYTDSIGTQIKMNVNQNLKAGASGQGLSTANYEVIYPYNSLGFDLSSEVVGNKLVLNLKIDNKYHNFLGDVGINVKTPGIFQSNGEDILKSESIIMSGLNSYSFELLLNDGGEIIVTPIVRNVYAPASNLNNLNGKSVWMERKSTPYSSIPSDDRYTLPPDSYGGLTIVNEDVHNWYRINDLEGKEIKLSIEEEIMEEIQEETDSETQDSQEEPSKQDFSKIKIIFSIIIIICSIVGLIFLYKKIKK